MNTAQHSRKISVVGLSQHDDEPRWANTSKHLEAPQINSTIKGKKGQLSAGGVREIWSVVMSKQVTYSASNIHQDQYARLQPSRLSPSNPSHCIRPSCPCPLRCPLFLLYCHPSRQPTERAVSRPLLSDPFPSLCFVRSSALTPPPRFDLNRCFVRYGFLVLTIESLFFFPGSTIGAQIETTGLSTPRFRFRAHPCRPSHLSSC